MPQSLVKNYIHIVFSTKYRQPLIDNMIKEDLFNYLGGTCKIMECNPLRVGGHKDHIHILCILSRKIALMSLIEEIKTNSSKWIKTRDEKYKNFYWQKGYGCFSVNPRQTNIVMDYIINQEKHHARKSFKKEYLALLHKYEMEYDERYVWD